MELGVGLRGVLVLVLILIEKKFERKNGKNYLERKVTLIKRNVPSNLKIEIMGK